ncbi:MAG TPA: thiol peroxidase [Lentisphaeria bacterium]|nr:MAG: lipid hydroperoxide peroxidase [Lentisphaerae bacterium GWF2_38_69]HBM14907.1 thiol peroxidase [Lentisphaeria bacterium]
MAKTNLKGNPVNTVGDLPAAGSSAIDFTLTKNDLSDVTLKDFKGSKIVLNIFPSVDTPVCATSVRKFNEKAAALTNTKVLCVSRDMPFAHARFCGAEGIKNVTTLSELRTCDFGKKYGVRIADGPLAGLLARSIIVIDSAGKVAYTQLAPEITEEIDYEKALAAVNAAR